MALTLVPAAAGAETFLDPDDRCPPGTDAPPAPVSDRAATSPVHLESVDCAFALGVAEGYEDGTYRPEEMTSRAHMAAFVVRTLEAAGYDLPAPEDPGFTDIAGNTHEEDIEVLATIGVTLGKTETTYAPDELVRRDQMASFIVRAAEYAFGDDDFLAEEGVPAFPDVTPANVHYDNVNTGALVLGLIEGKESGAFEPAELTQRQQMASFLVRLADLTLVVE